MKRSPSKMKEPEPDRLVILVFDLSPLVSNHRHQREELKSVMKELLNNEEDSEIRLVRTTSDVCPRLRKLLTILDLLLIEKLGRRSDSDT
jgi:hypothetical protein